MVKIITAESKDAKEILELQTLAYQSEAILYNDWSLPALTQSIESLQQELRDSIILKAIIQSKIVGSVRSKVENGVCKIGFALAWTLLHSIWQFAILAFCYVY